MKLRAARGVGLSPKIAVGAAGGILVLGLVVALATGHRGQNLADSMTQALASKTTAMGFTVQEIHVAGATPAGIRKTLQLNKPIYARTTAYGHFGRQPDNEGGFSWEKTDLVPQLQK
eukprot:gene23777-23826_t